jgi:low affinity Fe/Cu permease
MERLAVRTTRLVGSSTAFLLVLLLTAGWLLSGPFFGYTDTWQLAMNTVSSVVTLLMVFLLQRSQNKDTLAMQTKLNEIVVALPHASNRLLNIEDLSEEEVRRLHDSYEDLIRRLEQRRAKVGRPCSLDETLRQEGGGAAGDGPTAKPLGP